MGNLGGLQTLGLFVLERCFRDRRGALVEDEHGGLGRPRASSEAAGARVVPVVLPG